MLHECESSETIELVKMESGTFQNENLLGVFMVQSVKCVAVVIQESFGVAIF